MAFNNTNFNPTRLAGQVLRELRMRLVVANIVNRNYEGEIEGPEDTVDILELGSLTVGDYDPSSGITVQTEPTAETTALSMEQNKYFAFIADLADNAEAYAEIFQQEGVADLLREAQKYVLGKYTEAQNSNQVAYDPANDDIEEKIADAGENLDEEEVPEDGRWIVLPPTEVRAIEDKMSARDTPAGDDAIRAGYQGGFRGFDVYKAPSNHFTTTGTSPAYLHAMYGHSIAITYADAVLNTRVQESERYFGQQVDGLHVGGAKVVRPEAAGDFRIKQ